MLPRPEQESACPYQAIADETLMLNLSENPTKQRAALSAYLQCRWNYTFLLISYAVLIFLYIRLYFERWSQIHATRIQELDNFPCQCDTSRFRN